MADSRLSGILFRHNTFSGRGVWSSMLRCNMSFRSAIQFLAVLLSSKGVKMTKYHDTMVYKSNMGHCKLQLHIFLLITAKI